MYLLKVLISLRHTKFSVELSRNNDELFKKERVNRQSDEKRKHRIKSSYLFNPYSRYVVWLHGKELKSDLIAGVQ